MNSVLLLDSSIVARGKIVSNTWIGYIIYLACTCVVLKEFCMYLCDAQGEAITFNEYWVLLMRK